MYVTNKANSMKFLYIRLRSDKLGDSEIYSLRNCNTPNGSTDLEHNREQEEKQFSTLIEAGFCLLQLGIPKRFSVVSRDLPMYASVHDGNNLWIADMPVDPSEYSCVAIKETNMEFIFNHRILLCSVAISQSR